jgi:deoxyribonuclease V
MKLPPLLHRWPRTTRQAIALQQELAERIVRSGRVPNLRLAAGADVAFSRDKTTCVAGVIVWDLRAKQVVEQIVVRQPVRFPYVPGLLTFRETPPVLAAIRRLRTVPDVFLFDGQGIAHPRRIGFAAHTGLLLDQPAIGCAKSRLIGDYQEPGWQRGESSPLIDREEIVGSVLRTRDHVKPLFISIGHCISLPEAKRIVLACCNGCRVPEPTRLADILVARAKTDPDLG